MTPSVLVTAGPDPRARAGPSRGVLAPTLRRAIAALLLVLLGCLTLPLRAQAHAYLVLSNPRTGERFPTIPPAGLQLLFTQPVALAHGGVQLFDGRFQVVPGTVARVDPRGTSVSVSLPPLGPGDYAAIWTVVSADDGHLTDGEVGFSVGPAPSRPSLGVASLPVPPSGGDGGDDLPGTVATWLLLAGLGLAGGGLAGEALLGHPGGSADPRVRLDGRHLGAAIALAVVGALGVVVVTAGRLHDGSAASGLDLRSWGPALGVRAVVEDLAGLGLVVNALGALVLLRDRLVALASLVGAMALVGLRSHPASAGLPGELAVSVHVIVALLWSGGLAHLVVLLGRRRHTLRTPETAAVIERYTRAALLSVLVILLTGGAAALTQLASPVQLLTTGYGRLLTLKLGLVAGTLLVAMMGRWRGLRRGAVDPLAVRRAARAEVGGLVLVLLATAALANAAPPAPPIALGGAPATAGLPLPLILLGAALLVAVATPTLLRGRRVLRVL
jgi:copper transport protein